MSLDLDYLNDTQRRFQLASLRSGLSLREQQDVYLNKVSPTFNTIDEHSRLWTWTIGRVSSIAKSILYGLGYLGMLFKSSIGSSKFDESALQKFSQNFYRSGRDIIISPPKTNYSLSTAASIIKQHFTDQLFANQTTSWY